MADAGAQCRLGDFLGEPEPPPPADWVNAVVHDAGRDHAAANAVDRAEQARSDADEAEQRIASLNDDAGTDQQALDRATGHLVAVFNVTFNRAFECIAWVAQESDVGITTAARRFVAGVDSPASDAHDRDELLALLGDLSRGPRTRAG